MRKLKNEELNRPSVEEFIAQDKNDVIVILDNIRSLNNVGSAFRTSDAFNVRKIYLCGITGTPPHRDINKTALGSTETVAWEHAADTTALVKQLQADGWTVFSIEQAEGATMLNDFHPIDGGKYCFVFGNEVFGVEQTVVTASDGCLEIPQFGTKHSLNISVTIGVVLWHYINKIL
ncbi:RNA methyltransferase [Reichenbachiella agarivorans]|uniref:RNA methyltransferase n=1 Tax=Reichenbachiella agarivorans TaxID=2979464 RepID=A0ABY6CUG0_9BACT|nr:RNA methyltransferase [Reichenbachiella agarivorans]UXP33083.1 RNA methyltransferase [Reichenbachiella agarivorans]